MKTLALYFHIPFCNGKKCEYCNFVSFTNKENLMETYVDALIREIRMRGEKEGKEYKVSSIYFGGGTPSTLKQGMITNILWYKLSKGFGNNDFPENINSVLL